MKWTVWLTKDAIWERFHTISHIANLHGDELEVSQAKPQVDMLILISLCRRQERRCTTY